MEFISLSEVLCNIAERIQLDRRFPCSNTRIGKISLAAANEFWYAKKNNHPLPDGDSIDEKIEWARKIGIAARNLNNAVLNSSDAPLQWAEFEGQLRVNVSDDLLKQEALGILAHATGWGNRLEEKYNTHFRNAITQGDEALKLSVSVAKDEGLTRDEGFLRLLAIGCDRVKLIAMLEKNDIENSLEVPKTPACQPLTPTAVLPSTEGPAIRHKLRINSLDAPIKKAIENAGCLSTGAVYVELRQLALAENLPFTGEVEGDSLCYTKDDNKPAKLTKNALGKRLKNHVL
jgi:hypothetical protein